MTSARLSPTEILLVDALCDQFEGEIERGERPAIEDFLNKAPPEIHSHLFVELLRCELGDPSRGSASRDTYIERFPQFAQVVRQSWPDGVDATITTPPIRPPHRRGAAESEPRDERGRSRYAILKSHAKGGLGEVFLAEDRDLHRRVAVKEIQSFAADDPESRARFLLEAEITGRLEHPGIVPVYSLGVREDGRPYYAMRFIQGRSLKESIEAFYADRSRSAQEKVVEFRQLLTRFVAVCQAIAFAHDRGILHRDLKPANIMLGKFGETLVVDWGLAKVLGKPGPDASEASALVPKGKDDSSETRHGAIVGTPAYMSPEQARGEIDELGPAADIYSLGATLYSIVTGERPVSGQSTAELLRKVREGKTELAQRPPKGASPSLLAICRKAMAPEPVDRFPTALALAADVERWLADEPVHCYREPRLMSLRRWMRRHMNLVSAASASLLVLLLALAGGSAALGFKNQQLQEANGRHLAAKQAAELAQARAEAAAQEEREANAIAQRRLQQIREHNLVLKDIFRDINPLIGPERGMPLSAQLGKRLSEAAKRLNSDAVDDPVYVGDLQATLGNALDNLGYSKEAIELHHKALETSLRANGEDDANTLTCLDNLANAYRKSGQPAEALAHFEKALAGRRKTLGPNHADTLRTMNNLANAYGDLGQNDKALALLETVTTVLKNSVGEDHGDTLAAQNNLAAAYSTAGRYPEAIALYQQVHDKHLARYGAEHGLVIASKNNLAFALVCANEPQRAVPFYEEALAGAAKTLGDDHPTSLALASNLASALARVGQVDRAIALQESTLARKKARFGPENPATLASMSGLAAAYFAAGKLESAIRQFEETLAIKLRVHGEKHPEYLRTLGSLGGAQLAAKRGNDAIATLERCHALWKTSQGPEHPETRTTLHNLCMAYLRGGVYERGKGAIDEYLDLRRRSARPGDAGYIDFLWEFSNELFAAKRFGEAETLLRECLTLRKQYGKEQGNEPWRVFSTQSLLGAALAEQQKFAEAEPMLLEAFEKLSAAAAELPKTSRSIPVTAARLARLYEAQGAAEAAEKWKAKERELTPPAAEPPISPANSKEQTP